MAQKVIKIGSSTGVVIPKSILEKAQLSAGSFVDVALGKEGSLTITPVKKATPSSETAQWATQFVQEHIEAFKELADK